MHGEVEGAMPEFEGHSDRSALRIPAAVVSSPAWDYVALGDIHVYKKVGPKAFYSGALDYTSPNVWGEIEEQRAQKLPGKGMIERDLETGKQTFHPLPVTREFLDLPPIGGRGLSAADLDAAIAAAVARTSGGIDGKVVRLVVRDVPRHIARELDHKMLREFQRRALHFHLDMRRPEVMRTFASGAPGRRPSLADMLRESLRNRVLTSDIDRDRLVELGAHYLREAEQVGTTRDLSASAEET
jgi:DNA repair exonuclease SbcCD nuclease subunit